MQSNGVRNRALLTGVGWTLAAALAWFRSSLPEPIYLGSPGVVALGGAAMERDEKGSP